MVGRRERQRALTMAWSSPVTVGAHGHRDWPGDKPLGWTASASDLSAQSGSWTLEVYVICATVTG